MDRPARHDGLTAAVAVAVPLGLIAGALLLWSLSDQALVVFGLLDRAAFGWLVVMPMLASVPIAGGIVLARTARRAHWPVAILVGTVAGLAVGGLFLRSVAVPDCEFGAVRTAVEWLPNAAGVGLASGAPLAIGLVSVARLWPDHRIGATFAGLLTSAAGFLLLMAVLAMSFQPLCNRPV